MQLAPGLTKRTAMVQQMLHRKFWLTNLAAAMTSPQKCHTKRKISVSPYTSLVECQVWVCKPATSMGLPHHQTWQSMPSSQHLCSSFKASHQLQSRMQKEHLPGCPSSLMLLLFNMFTSRMSQMQVWLTVYKRLTEQPLQMLRQMQF